MPKTVAPRDSSAATGENRQNMVDLESGSLSDEERSGESYRTLKKTALNSKVFMDRKPAHPH
jgi:hypothetical protein